MRGWTFLLVGLSVCFCPGRDTHVNLRCSGCVYVCLSREQELAVLGVCFQYMFMFVSACLPGMSVVCFPGKETNSHIRHSFMIHSFIHSFRRRATT